MGESGEREWVRTLNEVGAAIADCLTALDRYEERFVSILSGQKPSASEVPLGPCDWPSADTDPAWQDRLAQARAGALEVERLLEEQETAWGQWREALANWRRRIEHPSGEAAEPPG
jgi:hypothetical protein